MSLPSRSLGSLTWDFPARSLILVPWAGFKDITAVKAKRLFHNHLLLVRENGSKIENLFDPGKKRNEKDSYTISQRQQDNGTGEQ
jgi:hypothetical protein